MAGNLIDMFKNTIGDVLIRHASGSLGESADHIASALDTLLPVLMSTVIQKGNTPAGARDLMGYIRDNGLEGDTLTQIGAILGDPLRAEDITTSGAAHLKYLLGDSLSAVIDAVAAGHGLKTSSASSLVKLTAPLLLNVVSRYSREKSLDAAGLTQLLVSHADAVKQAIPASLATLPALSMMSIPVMTKTTLEEKYGAPAPPTGWSRLLPWIILLLASLGLFYLVEKGCASREAQEDENKEMDKGQDVTPASTDTMKLDSL